MTAPPLVRVPLGCGGLESAFEWLAATGRPMFWLDSGVDATYGRSYLGVAAPAAPVVTANESGLVSESIDGVTRYAGQDLLAHLRRGIARAPLGRQKVAEPGRAEDESEPRFALGWVGWFGYEFGARRMGAHAASAPGPSAALFWADRMLVLDHATGAIEAHMLEGEWNSAWCAQMAPLLAVRAVPVAAAPTRDSCGSAASAGREPAADYRRLVERAQDRIRVGDAYQLCLTTQRSAPAPSDAAASYLRLRRSSPSGFGGFLRVAGITLLSASPERFLAVTPQGVVASSPIKGTRPRAQDAAEDERLASELASSEKELAENVMIVDLVRNDLARVAVPGSVAVTELTRVHSHRHVHQLVSTVAARLAPGRDALDALDACFPAGSMTGAPKRSAVDILHELERAPRGAYAGCFGYLGRDGAAELAMTIRTIVTDGASASVGTGGGITILSVPEEERAEMELKAEALLRVLDTR